MIGQRFWLSILIFGTGLTILGIFLSFREKSLASFSQEGLITQNVNEYQGPTQKVPGNPQLIRVQILINDDPSPQGVQIEKVEFNQKKISLKPRDIYGFRGQGSFQLPPGNYKLKWTVRRDKYAWPRTLTHEEEVELSPKDLWIQITITGEQASLS